MKLYPDATAGYMIRWTWGISRLIGFMQSKSTDVDRGKWIPWSTPELK